MIDASNFMPLSPLFLHPAKTISMTISQKVRAWSGCMPLVYRNSNHDHCMMVQILAGCKLMVWQEEPSA